MTDVSSPLVQEGRELNIAIAEKVMGWEKTDALVVKGWHRHVGPFEPTRGQFLVMDSLVTRRVSENRWEPFDPSSSIADAFLVVAAMRAKALGFHMHDDNFGCRVTWESDDELIGRHAHTPQLAICLASLAALAPKSAVSSPDFSEVQGEGRNR